MSGAAVPALPFNRAAALEVLRERLFAPSGQDLVGLEAELRPGAGARRLISERPRRGQPMIGLILTPSLATSTTH